MPRPVIQQETSKLGMIVQQLKGAVLHDGNDHVIMDACQGSRIGSLARPQFNKGHLIINYVLSLFSGFSSGIVDLLISDAGYHARSGNEAADCLQSQVHPINRWQ